MERGNQDSACETTLPKCMAIRHGSCYLRSAHGDGHGVVVELGDGDGHGGANNPRCRFYLEASKEHDDSGLMHVRCCHNNKYWVPQQRGQDGWIIGTADEPEEDLSKPSWTLFNLLILPATEHEERSIRFHHHKLGKCVAVLPSSDPTRRPYLHVAHGEADAVDAFTFLDLSQQKQLPRYLAFKGDNGKYLSHLIVGNPFVGIDLFTLSNSMARGVEMATEQLHFASEDINDLKVRHTSFTNDDGTVRIKSNYNGKFWRLHFNTTWIFVDSGDNTNCDRLFKVIAWDTDEAGNNFIVLQNQGNKKICKRVPTDGTLFFPERDLLGASDDSITQSARLQLAEPVLSRLIYDIHFHLSEARVYTKEVREVATRTAVNGSNSNVQVKLTFTDTHTETRTWNSSVSVKGGVRTTFKTGFPSIVDGKVEVSAEVAFSQSWGGTVTETKTRTTEYTAVVPPRTKVEVRAVASTGACDVPYSYTQKDVLLGCEEVVHEFHDGIFTGVSDDDIQYEVTKEEPL